MSFCLLSVATLVFLLTSSFPPPHLLLTSSSSPHLLLTSSSTPPHVPQNGALGWSGLISSVSNFLFPQLRKLGLLVSLACRWCTPTLPADHTVHRGVQGWRNAHRPAGQGAQAGGPPAGRLGQQHRLEGDEINVWHFLPCLFGVNVGLFLPPYIHLKKSILLCSETTLYKNPCVFQTPNS